MKVVVLYQPNSEHARTVEEHVHDFQHEQPSRKVELVDADSREGAALMELYDIVQYPAVLALDNAGGLLKSWQGAFPLANELAYYTQDN